MNSSIWAIPGFLGLPSDWSFLSWNHLVGVDLYAFSWESLSAWAKQFNEWVGAKNQQPAVLMGYSLGGRLALHALIDRPEQWQAAIIISAHMGLKDAQEREKRLQQDLKWADRFAKEEWTSLMQAWNGQEVFTQDHFHFDRHEQSYQRQHLVNILTQGSLAKQADLRQQIANLPIPLLWVTGSLDQRYNQIAQTLTFANPYSRWEKIGQAGHRAPWAQSQIFSQLVQAFLQQIQ